MKIIKILSVLIFFFFLSFTTNSYAAAGDVTGWAWGADCINGNGDSNCTDTNEGIGGIGWIRLDGVKFDTNTGIASGYAWSGGCINGNGDSDCTDPGEEVGGIGWISFNNSEVSSGTGCPNGAPSCGPSIDWNNPNADGSFNMRGFIRACSVFVSGCSGLLKNDIYRGGWDGFISLGDGSSSWGVKVEAGTGKIKGFAWGSSVVGWVDFAGDGNTKIDFGAVPVVTVTMTTAYGGSTGSAYYGEPTAKVYWTATNSPTSCTLFKNNISVGSTFTSPYSVPSLTELSTNYRVDCRNNAGTGIGNTVTFTVPPPPTGLVSSCPSPGTTSSMSWNLSSPYTKTYLRAYKTPPSSADHNAACNPAKNPPDGACVSDIGTSYNMSSTSGAEYYWYVHTQANDGNWSDYVSGGTFTCGVPAPTPTGSLSVLGCGIALNASTCNASVTWSVTDPIGGAPTVVSRNNPSDTTVSNALSGTNVSNTVNYGQSIYSLFHNDTEIAPPVVINVSCDSGSWDGTKCASVPVCTGGKVVSGFSCVDCPDGKTSYDGLTCVDKKKPVIKEF